MERPTKKIADPGKKSVVLRARASAELRDALWAECARLAIDESEAIRRAILFWVKSHQSKTQRGDRLSAPTPDLVMLNAPKKGKIKQ